MINGSTQKVWYDEILSERGVGWLGIVCGDVDYCRLFAYHIAGYYANPYWYRVTGSRYTQRVDRHPLFIVDALVSFADQIDPIRFGNNFDFCSEHRGKSSVLVICAGMEPQKVCDSAHLKPDYMFSIRTKQKRET